MIKGSRIIDPLLIFLIGVVAFWALPEIVTPLAWIWYVFSDVGWISRSSPANESMSSMVKPSSNTTYLRTASISPRTTLGLYNPCLLAAWSIRRRKSCWRLIRP